MRDAVWVARTASPTPRARRIAAELRRYREAAGMTLDQVAEATEMSRAWVSKVELAHIKVNAGHVLQLLRAYGVDLDSEAAMVLTAEARAVRREVGWWQRLGSLPAGYTTYIAYEAEAQTMVQWEPSLIPGLLQTPAYARKINSLGREMDAEAVEQSVEVRLRRQEVLTRKPQPLQLHALLSEAALRVRVGGDREILDEQLNHLLELSRYRNITIQVLTFMAGEHLADSGAFCLLSFGGDNLPLGYIETLAGNLFLEHPRDTTRLREVHNNLKVLALSPAESADFIQHLIKETK